MGRINDERLFNLIHDYFMIYLPNYKSASNHTLRSYQNSINAFMEFLKEKNNVSIFDIRFDMFTRDAIQDYADWLQVNRKLSLSTCQNRLAALKAFLKYCAASDTSLMKFYLSAKNVNVASIDTTHAVNYLSEYAMRMLIEQPDKNTLKGYRDMVLMIFLYDTAARVSEAVNVKLRDLNLGSTPTVLLFGKGSKYRSVPLSERTVAHLKKYIAQYHPGSDRYSEQYLFYGLTSKTHSKMSANNVRTIVQTYAQTAKRVCHEIPKHVHPHMFRHSRAMHLYQNGMDLTLISQWLGHANLQTTLVYAHADTEQKRRAIELATKNDNIIPKGRGHRFSIDDEETLKRLYGLK